WLERGEADADDVLEARAARARLGQHGNAVEQGPEEASRRLGLEPGRELAARLSALDHLLEERLDSLAVLAQRARHGLVVGRELHGRVDAEAPAQTFLRGRTLDDGGEEAAQRRAGGAGRRERRLDLLQGLDLVERQRAQVELALVAEGAVEAALQQAHRARQVDHRGGLEAALPEA